MQLNVERTIRGARGRGGLALVLAVAVATLAALVPSGAPSAAAATVEGRQGTLVANGAWCWFQDPRAIHHVGQYDRTYVGYVTSAGDIEVVSVDNGTGVLTRTVLHPKYQADDHAAPGIVVLPNGTVAVFYSPHSGAMMNYRLSSRPEDIGSFGPELTVPTNTAGGWGFTYANPIYLSAEKRTYLFFRGGDFKPVVTSSTDLVHWTPARTVVFPDAAGSTARPYAKYATNGTDTIVMAFDDGHPRNVPTNSVYAMVLRGRMFRSVDGRALATVDAPATGVPALPVHTRDLPPLYNGAGPGGKAWVHSAALDPSGAPVVAFASFPVDLTPTDTDHRYHYARWNGTAWTQREFAAAGGAIDTTGLEPDYSGGMDLDRNDPSVLYASRQVAPSAWVVERWHTPDGGRTFDPPVNLTPGTTVKNVRPVVPWGPPGDVRVLWMSGRYDHWNFGTPGATGYSTALRLQSTGPLPTTARISTSAPVVGTGQLVTVAARHVSGYEGPIVAGTRAELWATSDASPPTLRAVGTTDATGLVRFDQRPAATTRYEIRFPGSTSWAASRTPSTTVTVRPASAVRIAVDRTSVRAGQPVVVGMRVVNAATNLGVAGVPVQLWQTVDGRTWLQRATVTTDATGLARATRSPLQSVTYQARFPGSAAWAPSSSGTLRVTVTR